MVSIQPSYSAKIREDYQIPGSKAVQNIDNIINNRSTPPTVEVNERDVMTPRIHDALSRIQELVEKGVNSSGIMPAGQNLYFAQQGFYQGSLNPASSAQYSGFEGVPEGNFQVYTPPSLEKGRLEDLVKLSVSPGGALSGNEKLFRAVQDGTAKIYNQGESENLIGKAVDWKQGSVSGTMWDKSSINEQHVQQVQTDGKQIFSGAIGSIRFAVVY